MLLAGAAQHAAYTGQDNLTRKDTMSQFDDYPSQRPTSGQRISAESFAATLAANVDNQRMSADAFRELVRSTLPIVEYPRNQAAASVQAYPGTAGSQFDDRMTQR